MVFQRIVNYWVSTFITEKLLSSPAFHRMAATTHKHVSNVTNKGMNPAKQNQSASLDLTTLAFCITRLSS